MAKFKVQIKIGSTILSADAATLALVDVTHDVNRELLASCLGCSPDLVDDIVAVWAKR